MAAMLRLNSIQASLQAFIILGLLQVAFSAAHLAAVEREEPGLGIDLLYRLDRLPAFKESVLVASQSSYDRSGGNNDGFSGKYSFVRKEGDGLVLVDLKGPGVITRIWTPTPTEDSIEFLFDGEETPRISLPFRDLFTGSREPFVKPLVGYGAGGFYSYIPLPFQKSCKVIMRAETMKFYQINYALYPEDSPVVSYQPSHSMKYLEKRRIAQELFASCGADISAYTARVPDARQVHRTHCRLAPQKTCTLFETDQPGRIVGLRLGPAAALVGKERAIVLRATWDGDPKPAIQVPAGDLFGYAWGKPAIKSLMVGTAENDNYIYFPMPFDRSAKIELLSERTSGAPLEIDAEVVMEPAPRMPDEGKFYAVWRRENPTTKGRPFTFIETSGRGHLVGCIQQSQGFESGNTYFFEGDDQTTIDGQLVIHGTGSEDLYNGGWYDVPGRWETGRSFPLSGCLGYQKHLARTGGYRLMLADAYAFRKSILHTIEHAPTENSLTNDYCGVTFLYSQERPSGSLDLPPLEQRQVVDLRRMVFSVWWNVPIHAWSFSHCTLSRIIDPADDESDGRKVRYLSLQATEQDIFGNPFISFSCELPAAGRYRISIEAAAGPDQAVVQLFRDEAPVGKAVDFYAPKRKRREPQFLGSLELEEGPNALMFKLVGKNQASSGLRFDLRNIICERID
jgi:D-arabinan exo alpha-(1,3)/(1,5)-arabinofuranosidase (non-reducing end)